MKIRTDFVTNSSFLLFLSRVSRRYKVMLDRRPAEIRLFGKQKVKIKPDIFLSWLYHMSARLNALSTGSPQVSPYQVDLCQVSACDFSLSDDLHLYIRFSQICINILRHLLPFPTEGTFCRPLYSGFSFLAGRGFKSAHG